MESDAVFYSIYDVYKQNTGVQNGGGIFATTRTFFFIKSSKFLSNYANSDSAISAYITSTLKNYVIDNCEFANNSADSNTISLKNANGDISNCVFTNNMASVYTGNIFVSFSNVNVSSSTFYTSYSSSTNLKKLVENV